MQIALNLASRTIEYCCRYNRYQKNIHRRLRYNPHRYDRTNHYNRPLTLYILPRVVFHRAIETSKTLVRDLTDEWEGFGITPYKSLVVSANS